MYFAANPHRDFDGGGAALRYNVNVGDVADGDALECDRGAALQSAGIIEIGAKDELGREQASLG